jgi:hypothetical protein
VDSGFGVPSPGHELLNAELELVKVVVRSYAAHLHNMRHGPRDPCTATAVSVGKINFLVGGYPSRYSLFFDPEEFQKRFGCSLRRSDNSPPAGACVRAKEKCEGSVEASLLFAFPSWSSSVVPSKEVGL